MYRLMCSPEDITHGQRFILTMMDKRELAQLCRDKDFVLAYMFNVGIGKHLPPIPVIYKLKDIIHPNSWFYRESETLETPEYREDTGETWEYQKSKGYKKLASLVEPVGVRSWAKEHNIDHSSLWMILSGKRKPSFLKIRSLAPIVTPSDWFYIE